MHHPSLLIYLSCYTSSLSPPLALMSSVCAREDVTPSYLRAAVSSQEIAKPNCQKIVFSQERVIAMPYVYSLQSVEDEQIQPCGLFKNSTAALNVIICILGLEDSIDYRGDTLHQADLMRAAVSEGLCGLSEGEVLLVTVGRCQGCGVWVRHSLKKSLYQVRYRMALNGLHVSALSVRPDVDICLRDGNNCILRMANKVPFPLSWTPGSGRLRTRIGENTFSSMAGWSSISPCRKKGHFGEKNTAARHLNKTDNSTHVACPTGTTTPRTSPRIDPSEDLVQFLDSAKQSNLIPLFKRVFSDQLTPVLAFRSLVKENDLSSPSFLFEAVEQGKSSNHEGRFSVLGMQPAMEIIAKENKVTVLNHDNSSREEKTVDDPMTEAERLSSRWKPARVDGLPETFSGGWVGYFSYDTMRYVEKEKLPFKTAPEVDRVLPDIHLGLYTDILLFDHVYKMVYAVHWVQLDNFETAEQAYHSGKLRLDQLVRSIQAKTPKLPAGALDLSIRNYWEPNQGSNMTKKEYKAKITKAKEHILAGDISNIVLSQRFERTTTADPFDVYRALRVVNPSPYMIYLQARGSVMVGASPETLARVQKVTGDVKKDMTPWDVLRAALPVQTVSGAPKVRAMQLIDELEPTRRGPYGGGIGHVSFTGDMDIALVLRTMVFRATIDQNSTTRCQNSPSPWAWLVHLQAEAGVVADSDPESKHQECVNKASEMSRVIDLAETNFVEDAGL